MLDFIDAFCDKFPGCVDEYETLLTDNRIWKQRTVGIGVVTPEEALQLGFSGPMVRLPSRSASSYPSRGRSDRPCWNWIRPIPPTRP